MPDPMRVEVVCPACAGTGRDPHYGSGGLGIPPKKWSCIRCLGRGVESLPPAPGSLTEAKLELAEAVDEHQAATDAFAEDRLDGLWDRMREAQGKYLAALAAVRAHPDHKAEATNG